MNMLECDVLAANGKYLIRIGCSSILLCSEIVDPVCQRRRNKIGRCRCEACTDDHIRALLELPRNTFDCILAEDRVYLADQREGARCARCRLLDKKRHECLVVQHLVQLAHIHRTRDIAVNENALCLTLRQRIPLDRGRVMRHPHHEVTEIVRGICHCEPPFLENT